MKQETKNPETLKNLTDAYVLLAKVAESGSDAYRQFAQQKADSIKFHVCKLVGEMNENEESFDNEIAIHMINGWA